MPGLGWDATGRAQSPSRKQKQHLNKHQNSTLLAGGYLTPVTTWSGTCWLKDFKRTPRTAYESCPNRDHMGRHPRTCPSSTLCLEPRSRQPCAGCVPLEFICRHLHTQGPTMFGNRVFKEVLKGLPCGPVVKNSPFEAGNVGLIPGPGIKIPHAAGQLSPCSTTTEPATTTTRCRASLLDQWQGVRRPMQET